MQYTVKENTVPPGPCCYIKTQIYIRQQELREKSKIHFSLKVHVCYLVQTGHTIHNKTDTVNSPELYTVCLVLSADSEAVVL